MEIVFKPVKLSVLLSMMTLGVSLVAHAAPGVTLANWRAHPPIHLRSTKATLAPAGLTPAQIKKAYGFSEDFQGEGQVIAIIDAFDDPNIENDLGTFSKSLGLPACTTKNGCFTKVYASGTKPQGNPGWSVEMALDVEWAHAIAPKAKILLVEAKDNTINLYSAINTAIANHATVISLSWGGAEFPQETSLDFSYFQNSPVPIVVSSGDSGTGVMYPAASPYVLSVGGTQLTLDSEGNYQSETAWHGSGGGISRFEMEPDYQTSFSIPNNGKGRGVPDVAYNGSERSPVAIYDSYQQGGWLQVYGTSAGAPQWAALIAIMNSARGKDLTGFNTSLYKAGMTDYSTLFNDITTGSNGLCGYLCTAQKGYDYVTGLGSPKTSDLIAYFNPLPPTKSAA